jgi:hypothetical protein
METRKPSLHLAENFEIGAKIDAFQTLGDIKQLALEASKLIGIKSWTEKSLDDVSSSESDLRAGFIGQIAIHEVHLTDDGAIKDPVAKVAIDGLLFELEMSYMLTGKKNPITSAAGLVIGNGVQRFEVRAYNLETKRFGRIHNEELQDYLAKSAIRGAGTASGKSTKRSTGLGSIRSSH